MLAIVNSPSAKEKSTLSMRPSADGCRMEFFFFFFLVCVWKKAYMSIGANHVSNSKDR